MGKYKVLPINCTTGDKDFFDLWVEWLRPIHKLTNGEQKLLAAILRHRHTLSKGITDSEMLERLCTDSANLDKVRETMQISSQQMNGIMLRLKKARVLAPVKKLNGRAKYYKIAPSIIPQINKDKHTCIILDFDYDFKDTK